MDMNMDIDRKIEGYDTEGLNTEKGIDLHFFSVSFRYCDQNTVFLDKN